VKENEKNKNSNVSSITTTNGINPYRILSMIICIFVFLIAFFYFSNVKINDGVDVTSSSDNTSSKKTDDTPSSSKLEQNEVSTKDGKISSLSYLFGYENSSMNPVLNSIYKNETINIADLTLEHKNTILLNYFLNIFLIENSYARCDEINQSTIDFECNQDGFAKRNGVILSKNKFSGAKLLETYKEVFGLESEYTLDSFNTIDGYYCQYNNPDYLCIFTGEKAIGIETFPYVIKAFEYGDKMEIHTKYVWLEGSVGYSNLNHDETYFDDFVPASGVSNYDTVKYNYSNEIKTYIHTFIKNSDGTYYWSEVKPAS